MGTTSEQTGLEPAAVQQDHHHKDIEILLINEDDHRHHRLHGRADTRVRAMIAEAYREMGIEPHHHDLLICKGTEDEVFEYADEELGRYVERHCRAKEWIFRRRHEVRIFVNTRPREWKEKEIDFLQVVELAFPGEPPTDTLVYTVTYSHGPHQNPKGDLVKGQYVRVKNGMDFSVKRTNKS